MVDLNTYGGRYLKNILSIDVEDWYHILDTSSTPGINEWNHLKPRVTKNFYTLLDVFDTNKVKVTCFFLGWIAEKFPDLVKEADRRGHEIASHGYAHQLIYKQSRVEFAKDIRKAKALIENISGKPVLGYRAPGFSIIESTKWAFDELSNAGYLYDSSIFPTVRGHGGIQNHKIRFKNLQFLFGGTDEHVLDKVSLPGHFHDEPDLDPAVLIGTYEAVLYIKLFPGKLLGRILIELLPYLLGKGFVIG